MVPILSRKRLVLAAGLSIVLTSVVLSRLPTQPELRHSLQPTAGAPSGLPLPSCVPPREYEERLFDFLNSRAYEKLGWLRDKWVRDTGPFVDGKYYGTHPAVRVYYSPGVIRWLQNGRVGIIPDGEMIVKEQYPPPAIRHHGKTADELWDSLHDWTVMVKDSSGAHDGWYWSNLAKGQCTVDNHQYPFAYPASGFGLYCIRCHAVTRSPGAETTSAANEFTFASLRNVTGFPGEPISYRVDDSWRTTAVKQLADGATSELEHHDSHPNCTKPNAPAPPVRHTNLEFIRFFDTIKPVMLSEVAHLPPVTRDWVVAGRHREHEFITSSQCMSCHAGMVGPFGPSMFVPAGKSVEYGARGWDVSPYGEWQWTPMALAGRDPIFYAQLESEIQMLHDQFGTERSSSGELVRTLVDTCLRCHAAMGKRQFEKDRTASRFTLDHVHTIGDPAKAAATDSSNYGALARDGVGCAVCHRMQLPVQPATDRRPYLQFYLESATTGNFHLGKKGEIYGPFKNEEIAPYAMEHATGLKPTHSDYLKSSQLCGTCHTVALPIVGKPLDAHPSDHANAELMKSETVPVFRKFHHHLEQATYLEWLNSAYENEINKDNPQARTCQDCHMSRGLKDPRHGIDLPQIQTRIAAIQDTSYPEAENLAPHNDLQIRFREDGYRRHNFSGLNMFLLEMFNQCDDILGVRKTDFMTGSTQGIEHAMENYVQTAQNDVASVDVAADILAPNEVTAVVVVKNKVGHRFPTGVGFRRAFIELVLVEQPEKESGSERIVWASGRTNDLGVLTGMDGEPLPTEFFASDPISGQQRYQKHHAVIRFPDQVQIYETLLRNEKGQFTTSFINGCEIVKDNRLLPRGWKQAGPGPDLTGKFLEATFPDPQTARNPRYKDGSGSDEVTYHITIPDDIAADRLQVRATLYYQAIPPYYLRNLFATAADGPATRRLHYLCSHLNLNGTPIENWKLQIASAACRVIKD